MAIKQFGATADGAPVWLVGLKAGVVAADIISYGATIHRVLAPDRRGRTADVILGKDDMEGYASRAAPAAAVIGRVANRISDGSFMLGGKRYVLDADDRNITLHSGGGNYARRNFAVVEAADTYVRLAVRDHGEAGFPGEITVEVCYSLSGDGTLLIEYAAIPTADTPINLTNHVYYNLAGQGSGPVYGQALMIDAGLYTQTDDMNIPTGEIFKTGGTPFDFSKTRGFAGAMDDLKAYGDKHNGFDLNYVLNGKGWRKIAEAYDEGSGRALEAFTDLPGVQLYTANFIREGTAGKDGAKYGAHAGFCLETQFYPDSIHNPHFPGGFAKGGALFKTATAYRFFVK
jgi:aldose 1-epimerase